MTNKIIKTILCITIFIVGTSYSAEYLLNKSESDLLLALFLFLEAVGFIFLIYKPIKTLFK